MKFLKKAWSIVSEWYREEIEEMDSMEDLLEFLGIHALIGFLCLVLTFVGFCIMGAILS